MIPTAFAVEVYLCWLEKLCLAVVSFG